MTLTPPSQDQPSENTPRRLQRPMQLVGERAAPDQGLSGLIQTATTPPNPRFSEPGVLRDWKAGLIGALNGLALVLAVRFTLLVAILGAIALSVIVVREPDPWRLGALGIYAFVVVVPTIWLASRR